jgi:hypothetical protein
VDGALLIEVLEMLSSIRIAHLALHLKLFQSEPLVEVGDLVPLLLLNQMYFSKSPTAQPLDLLVLSNQVVGLIAHMIIFIPNF